MQKTRFLEATSNVPALKEPFFKQSLSDDFSDMAPAGTWTHAFIFVAGFSALALWIILFYGFISFCLVNRGQDQASTSSQLLESAQASSQSSSLSMASTPSPGAVAATHLSDSLWKQKSRPVSKEAKLPLLVAVGLWLKFWQLRHLARASSQTARTPHDLGLSGRTTHPIQA
jgi:hypothetical protein